MEIENVQNAPERGLRKCLGEHFEYANQTSWKLRLRFAGQTAADPKLGASELLRIDAWMPEPPGSQAGGQPSLTTLWAAPSPAA